MNQGTPQNIQQIVANGETLTYLQQTGKNMLDDLKDFTVTSNNMCANMSEKFANEFKAILQFSSGYKNKITSMSTDTNERRKKVEILKLLRSKLMTSSN